MVLQASALGRGGEVFVLDMGEPIRIVDLATDLIRLSGLEVGRDIVEWTSTPLHEGAPQMVVRGASNGRSCGTRDYFMPGLGGARHVGFRCCR